MRPVFSMKKILIILFLTLNYFSLYSQKQGNIWCFGDSAGIDFNQSPPTTFTSSVRNRGSCCSIADTSGSLLFYANAQAGRIGNTTQVWSSNHQLMQNGDSIVGQGWFYELVIVPNPSGNNTFYLFSIGVTNSGDSGLYYSVVDMNLNGGLGAVTQKNIRLQPFKIDDGLTAIKHGNGRDWWLFFRRNIAPSDTFYSYLIDPTGINNYTIQKAGSLHPGFRKQLFFNSNGSKLVATGGAGIIELFDFDRCTGVISNPINISQSFETPLISGAAISPNDSILYVSTNTSSPDTSYLFQYNLADTNIRLTKDTIHIYTYPPSVYEAGFLKLGPDKRIYVANIYYNGVQNYFPYADSMYNYINMNVGVIQSPDSIGSSCNFQPYSFYLGGKRSYSQFPNNPDYALGPITNSICDTVTSIDETLSQKTSSLSVFYHHAWQTAFINANGLKGSQLKLIVMDISGRMVYSEGSIATNGYFSRDLPMNDFASGLYLITIFTEKEKLTGKIVKP